MFYFFGPISSYDLLYFPTGNAGEVETVGMGDWPRPGLQPDLGRWSASPTPSLRAPAEGARGAHLSAVPKPPGPLG